MNICPNDVDTDPFFFFFLENRLKYCGLYSSVSFLNKFSKMKVTFGQKVQLCDAWVSAGCVAAFYDQFGVLMYGGSALKFGMVTVICDG